MSDLFLDPETGDIFVSESGQMRLTETVEEDAAQRLRCKLRFFMGDWFLASNIGMPFFEQILIKNANMATVRSIAAR